MAKPKFSLTASPTFKAKVAIPIPGGTSVDVEFIFKGRNREAFKAFIDGLKDREDAQDVLHDSFIKIFDKMNSFSGEGSFEGWMKRILANNCLNFLKDKKKILKIENELWVEREEPVFELAVNESMDIDPAVLMEMIQKLPVGYRTVFNMFVMDGFDHKAIAEKLNISEGTSRSQLLKARRYLKEKLTDYLKDERKKYKY